MRNTVLLAVVSAAALVAISTGPAQGAASATGNLRFGGTVKGDISSSGGETDTISVDLARGVSVNMKWSPGFNATLGVFDPSGNPISVGLDGARAGSVKAWPAPATGTYEFRISSADNSQGTYSLSVLPYWEKKVVLTGTGDTTLDLPMPASGAIKGKVVPMPGASNPSILSFMSPAGSEMLVSPVVGSVGVAKLKPMLCSEPGVYRFTASAAAGTKQFQAALTRSAPKLPKESLNISNGLDQVSFETGGVADYFAQRCTACHDWARSYAGVRGNAGASLGRMKSGNMPQGGPRASAAQIAIVSDWIKTGYAK